MLRAFVQFSKDLEACTMSNSVFQNVIMQLKEIGDRTFGVLDTEGCVVSPTILRSLSPECDAEVLRVVGLMPRWLPCTQNGAAVEADFVLPVNFVYR